MEAEGKAVRRYLGDGIGVGENRERERAASKLGEMIKATRTQHRQAAAEAHVCGSATVRARVISEFCVRWACA